MPLPAIYVHDACRTPSYRCCGIDVVSLLSDAALPIVQRFRGSIDSLIVSCQDPSQFNEVNHLAAALCDNLGLVGIEATRVENGSNAMGGVVLACKAARCGSNVLVLGGELMNDRRLAPARREEIISQVVPAKDRDYGVTMPAAVALITSAFCGHHGIDDARLRKLLEEVAVIEYNAASHSRYAQFQGEGFRKERMRERYRSAANLSWADPLKLYDLCPTTDGAGALLLSCKPQLDGHRASVKITGHALVNDYNRVVHREDVCTLAATELSAQRAYAMAGIPVHVRNDGTFLVSEWPRGFFLESHDAFGPLYLLNLMNLGVYTLFDAERAILEGRTDPTSPGCGMPVNPSGGLKDGHPVGGTGIIKMVESFWQIMGAPSGLDLRKAPFPFEPLGAVVHSVGGPGSVNGVVVMEHAESAPRPAIALEPLALTSGRRFFKNAEFPKEGRFIGSTRRHLYGPDGRTEVDHVDIGMVEIWEEGLPGPRKLGIPMDERPLKHGDRVKVRKSYRDERYHYEGIRDGERSFITAR
jgi:acetyl-CoA C-acetyltransferase/acetyl-CoA acyltransferase